MKPRKVTLSLEITTDLPIGVLRKTRSAILEVNGQPIGQVSVQQATASVVQPVTTTTPSKKRSK